MFGEKMLKVIKRDGNIESFKPAKIVRSIVKAGGTRKLGISISRKVRRSARGKKRTGHTTIRRDVMRFLKQEDKKIARKYSVHKGKKRKVTRKKTRKRKVRKVRKRVRRRTVRKAKRKTVKRRKTKRKVRRKTTERRRTRKRTTKRRTTKKVRRRRR